MAPISLTVFIPGVVSSVGITSSLSTANSLVLVVDQAHECRSWGQNIVDEDEDCLFGRELDSLTM
jgi:hypothetical protein